MYARHLPTKMAQVTLWTHLDETQNVIHSCIRFLLQLFLCSLFQKYVVLDIFLFYLGSLVSLLPDGTYINYRYQGHQERAPGPAKHFFRVSPARADRLNVFTLNLTVSCRVTWAWSEGVNLYSRQIMVTPRKRKTFAKYSGPGPPSGPPGPGNLYGLFPRLVGTVELNTGVEKKNCELQWLIKSDLIRL